MDSGGNVKRLLLATALIPSLAFAQQPTDKTYTLSQNEVSALAQAIAVAQFSYSVSEAQAGKTPAAHGYELMRQELMAVQQKLAAQEKAAVKTAPEVFTKPLAKP